MGQTQLLLIVLGVIIVGISIAAGINWFHRAAVETNRDQLISDLKGLSADAQAYYKKHVQFGGGGGSYAGWDIPEFYKRFEGGRIRVNVKANRDRVTLNGIGTEIGRNGRTKVRVRFIIRPNRTQIRIMN
jgi:hypothetical protein